MLDDSLRAALVKPVRVMQVIVLAMLASAGVMMAIAVMLIFTPEEPLGAPPGLLTVVALAVTVVQLPVACLLPRFLRASQLRRAAAPSRTPPAGQSSVRGSSSPVAPLGNTGQPAHDARRQEALDEMLRRVGAYQVALIVGAATLEGTAFFCAIAAILDGSLLPLAISLLLAMILATWLPSVGRVEAWLERTMREIPGPGWG